MKRADAKRQDSHKPEPAQPAVPIVATGREIQLSESRFRRLKGHRTLPTLIKALEESARARRSGIEHGVA